MTNSRKLDDEIRKKYLFKIMEFFKNNCEDVLQTGSNECVFPIVDEEGNEKWIQIIVKIPTGARDEKEFDGYGLAQAYKLKVEQNEQKKKEAERKKQKKIEEDRKKREDKK